MSVLLQGLSMPKGNPRTINLYKDGTWCDAYTTKDGKAIEVHTPHGRLVDAGELEKEFDRLSKDNWNVNIRSIRGDVYKEALDFVVVSKTVIEEEDGEE